MNTDHMNLDKVFYRKMFQAIAVEIKGNRIKLDFDLSLNR